MEYLTRDQLEELREFDAPTVCNALETFGLRPRTVGITEPGLFLRTADTRPTVGYAVTARVAGRQPGMPGSEAKLLAYYESLLAVPAPTVAVIQDIDSHPIGSFWGEVQATVHKALGAVGTLTDGGVRDIREVNELGFSMYSSQIHVSHGYVHVEDYSCTVEVCGMCVHPGDLIYADMHGAVVIPHEAAPKLAEACRRAANAELPMLEPCRAAIAAGVRPTMDDIRAWRKAMSEARNKA